MKLVAHLSDLHFGRTDAQVVDGLIADLERHHPDLAIISGDLTQRARPAQFAEARAFLDRLPCPAVLVPGNHDLAPLYRPLSRLFSPRARLQHHLPGHHAWPVWQDEEMVAIGLDSTRHLRWTSGKLRGRHLDHVAQVVAAAAPAACKIAFLHHPETHSPSGHPFEALAQREIDLILTGHAHHAHVDLVTGRDQSTSIVVQATTACSTRLRTDANGYALIRIDMPRIDVTLQGWSGAAFHPIGRQSFEKRGRTWKKSDLHQ
jgi:3',5'-cyclic AMP phosphodiesterase CpdA